MVKFRIVSCIVGLVLLMGGVAHAALLGLTLGTPDITSSFVSVNYNATSDEFNAQGIAMTLDLDGVAPPDFNIANGLFSINASIDGSGTATAGTLTINGSVNAAGPSLLTGTLSQFGYMDSPGGEVFEFLFSPIGGDLAGAFKNGPVGVILDAVNSGFTGVWTSNFANSGFGASDTAYVPEPGAFILLIVGFSSLIRSRRRLA